MTASTEQNNDLNFDQEDIRRFIGLIALLLPVAVVIAAWTIPESISGSYHIPTGFPFLPYFPTPRDIFVGALFVIGAFLMSYKGHKYDQARKFWHVLTPIWPGAVAFGVKMRKREEDLVSTAGGLSAWIVALFPTKESVSKLVCPESLAGFATGANPNQVLETVSIIHLSFASILFLTTVYFCLEAFKNRLADKIEKNGKAGPEYLDPLKRRLAFYYISGVGILLTILTLGGLAILDSQGRGICVIYAQTYWAEVVMLFLFALAWITASKPWGLRTPGEEAERAAKKSASDA